jgi:hypothetical protein
VVQASRKNGLHHLRDTTFAEDASQVRTGTGPNVMACLRTSPSACSAAPGPSTLPLPSVTTPATRPTPHHPRVNRTLRENAGALGQPQAALE